MRTSDLTTELTAEYGDVVPPTLIESAVASAAASARSAEAREQTARADVAALAEAVQRAADVQPA